MADFDLAVMGSGHGGQAAAFLAFAAAAVSMVFTLFVAPGIVGLARISAARSLRGSGRLASDGVESF